MKWCSIQDINYWNIKCCSCFFLYKNKFTTSCLFRWIVDHIMVYIWCIEYIFGIIVTCQSLKIITFPVLWALKLLCVLQNCYFIHSTHVNIRLVIRTENVFYEKLIFFTEIGHWIFKVTWMGKIHFSLTSDLFFLDIM